MAQSKGHVVTGERGFEASGAIAANSRVKLDANGRTVVAGDEQDIGVQLNETFALGDEALVRLKSAQGTTVFIAAGTVAPNDPLFPAAAGKVNATGTAGAEIGVCVAVQGTVADGVEIEGVYGFFG